MNRCYFLMNGIFPNYDRIIFFKPSSLKKLSSCFQKHISPQVIVDKLYLRNKNISKTSGLGSQHVKFMIKKLLFSHNYNEITLGF